MNTQQEMPINPVALAIEAKLTERLQPIHLQVINESGNHNVPKGSESHFKLVVVSEQFEGHHTLHRHRMVYGVLEEELAGPVHALALHTYTAAQWRELNTAPESPDCLGGMKAQAQGTNEA